jgi:hypothetical protein
MGVNTHSFKQEEREMLKFNAVMSNLLDILTTDSFYWENAESLSVHFEDERGKIVKRFYPIDPDTDYDDRFDTPLSLACLDLYLNAEQMGRRGFIWLRCPAEKKMVARLLDLSNRGWTDCVTHEMARL